MERIGKMVSSGPRFPNGTPGKGSCLPEKRSHDLVFDPQFHRGGDNAHVKGFDELTIRAEAETVLRCPA
jgi:hypothetical protein